ncbi:nuclear speckle splicing regulatory protein [Trifolium repens]|nr:nuclear speckle splicing regulatory protein [Trifolium repens]
MVGGKYRKYYMLGGKGGVGKTSCVASLVVKFANHGQPTVFLSHYMVWFQHFTVADFSVIKMSSLIKEQQKKALDEYPTIFDYDGVYDRMKEKVAHPLIQDGEERG